MQTVLNRHLAQVFCSSVYMFESRTDGANSKVRPRVAKHRCEMVVNDATTNSGSAMNEVLTNVCQVGVFA
jgi:hypothetical protein